MRIILTALVAALTAAGFASVLHADASGALFKETHKGKAERKVADDWWDNLPAWVAGLTTKNQFPRTHLPYEFQRDRLKSMRDGTNKFEIRDANKRQFNVYLMVQSGIDGNGLPQYTVSDKSEWLSWKSWPAKYIVETYPIESNNDDSDLVAFAAWLYDEKENELANRVLTVVHQRSSTLAPLIEAYICEKEKWDLPEEGLKQWNIWDIEYQKERQILVTPDVYEERLQEREKAAESTFKEIVKSRGDYKGRPPRRRAPSKQLVFIDWEIKQFQLKYGASDFAKKNDTVDTIGLIKDSIKDDLAIIKDNLKKADEIIKEPGNANQMEERAEYLEEVLKIDPWDTNLRSKVANAWYEWGNPLPHGNGCDRFDGMRNAIPHYEVILESYPNNTSILLALGRCWQAMENSKKARPYYEKVIEIDGTKGNAVTAKALIRNMEMKDANRSKQNK